MPIYRNLKVNRVVGSPDVYNVNYVKTYVGPYIHIRVVPFYTFLE